FDVLRNGQRSVTPSLMDTMLKALDTVNTQFQAVQDREALEAADPALLDELHRLCKPESEDEVATVVEEPIVTPEPVIPEPANEVPAAPAADITEAGSIGSVDEITQDEFEKLLDELHGKGAAPGASTSAPTAAAPVQASAPVLDNGDITDDEFERLLDELHGVGQSPSAATAAPVETPKAPEPAAPAVSAASGDSDLMTDEEFEKLLDELHGAGKGPTLEELDMATKPASALAPEAPKPAPVAQPAPVSTPASAPKPAAKPVAVKEEPKASAPAVKKPPQATAYFSALRRPGMVLRVSNKRQSVCVIFAAYSAVVVAQPERV
ncbi:chemotaxis protein CheA, partial [Vibrio parahaemolyticus AQ3810]